jgi:hypothetical protein
LFTLIQYRNTKERTDSGFTLASANKLRKIKGEARAQFNSHLEMLMKHELFGYDDWTVDEKEFTLRAYENDELVYEYRLEIISDFIGSPFCSICGAEVPYFND